MTKIETSRSTHLQQAAWEKTREKSPLRAEWMAHAEKPFVEDAMVLEGIARTAMIQKEAEPLKGLGLEEDPTLMHQAHADSRHYASMAAYARRNNGNIAAKRAGEEFDKLQRAA